MACRDNYSKRKAGRGDGSCEFILHHITEEFSSLPSPQLTSSRGSECGAEYERHKSPGDFKKESFKRSFKKKQKQHGSASSPDITDLTGDPEPTTSTSCPPTPTPQYHSLLPCTRAQKRSQGPSEGREGAKMKVSRFATLVNQASPQSDILCTNTDKFVLNTRRSLPNLIDGRRSRRREPRRGAAQSTQDTNTQCTLATMTSRTRNGLARAVAGDGWKKESCRGREAKRSGSSDSVAEVVVLDDDDEDVSLAVTGSEPGRQTAKEPHGQSPVRPHQTDVSLQETPSAQESNSASPSGRNTSLSSIAVLFSGTNTSQAAPPPPHLTRPPPVWSDACLGVETSQLSSSTSPPRSAPASAKKPPASHDLVSYSIDSDSEDDEGASSLQQVAREADAKSMANNRCASPLTSANGTLHNRPFTPRSTPNTYLPPRPGREVSVTDARLECATPSSSALNQSRGDENPCPSPSPQKSGVFVPRKRLSLRRGPRLSDVKPHDTDHQTVFPAHSHNPFRHNPVKKSPHFDKSGQADLTFLTDTPSANPVKKSPHFNKPVQADLASLTDTPSARPSSSDTLIPSDLNVAPLIESETSDDDDDLPALATSVFGNSSQREWETRRSQRVSVGSASGRELTIQPRAGARQQLSSTSEDDCVIAEEKAPMEAEAGPTLGILVPQQRPRCTPCETVVVTSQTCISIVPCTVTISVYLLYS